MWCCRLSTGGRVGLIRQAVGAAMSGRRPVLQDVDVLISSGTRVLWGGVIQRHDVYAGTSSPARRRAGLTVYSSSGVAWFCARSSQGSVMHYAVACSGMSLCPLSSLCPPRPISLSGTMLPVHAPPGAVPVPIPRRSAAFPRASSNGPPATSNLCPLTLCP